MLKFYGHPTCTTCKKAEKWLDKNNREYEWINIKETSPKKEWLRAILEDGLLTPKQIFNTSGKIYRELELKEKVEAMTTNEIVALLEGDGMMIRRPFITDEKNVSVGYNEEVFEELWGS
ncbi:Spx/MgsR family RNA polymerase-binding regulatory protein [Jeotgalibaca dankookensis]|uniref:Spx/MgsR family RNA polymerase-binding regulatory protein n=1 Tax=Jeotgalibaca dankookensis TaxID=708126 RepID=UPI0007808A84|nr:Spx/MgsR family RNA polymerase-binding regulatory protein [Jeotgalibaca dankookensis]